MAFQDRHYYREGGGATGNPLMWLLAGSVPLFTVWGVRVRMHALMILYMVTTLLFSGGPNGIGPKSALTSMAILFVSVLLHEFGHIWGARVMGGRGEEILMWPLGGLAYADPPRRPWPSLVTTICGPLVNVIICVITGIAIVILSRSVGAVPWFPLGGKMNDFLRQAMATSQYPTVSFYLFWIFLVNYGLTMFNLCLVFYPFDGGRIVQELLWFKYGYYKSMMFATAVGMVGACVAAAFGLVWLSLMLILIAGFGFYTCWQQRTMLKQAGPEEFEAETLYAAAYEPLTPKRKQPSRWAVRRAAKKQQQEREEQENIDAILAKVSASGMNSLTWWEKRTLQRATERQRKADADREAKYRRSTR
jgi:stage IV sporulation protein FB